VFSLFVLTGIVVMFLGIQAACHITECKIDGQGVGLYPPGHTGTAEAEKFRKAVSDSIPGNASVPILIALVYVALWAVGGYFTFWADEEHWSAVLLSSVAVLFYSVVVWRLIGSQILDLDRNIDYYFVIPPLFGLVLSVLYIGVRYRYRQALNQTNERVAPLLARLSEIAAALAQIHTIDRELKRKVKVELSVHNPLYGAKYAVSLRQTLDCNTKGKPFTDDIDYDHQLLAMLEQSDKMSKVFPGRLGSHANFKLNVTKFEEIVSEGEGWADGAAKSISESVVELANSLLIFVGDIVDPMVDVSRIDLLKQMNQDTGETKLDYDWLNSLAPTDDLNGVN
jgi:hypothetical protein